MQLSKRSEQVTLSLNLNEYGSIGAGYFDVRAGDGTRTRLINLSYSKPLWGSSSVYLSANREVGGAGAVGDSVRLARHPGAGHGAK